MQSKLPDRDTREYEWWLAGATAEVEARKEGRSKPGLQVRSFVDGLAEHYGELDEAQIAAFVFKVYTAGLPLRIRIRLALKGPTFSPRGKGSNG